MLTDESSRQRPHQRPHEVHARGARPAAPPPSWGEDQGEPAARARTVHRLRRIRRMSADAISDIDLALTDQAPWHRAS